MTAPLIFDLDGVLVETADVHAAAWRSVARMHGLEVDAARELELRGVPREKCLDVLLAGAHVTPAKRAFLLAEKDRRYRHEVARRGIAIRVPGVDALLRDLRAHGHRIAVASASRNAMHLLHLAALASLVDHVSDGHFPGAPKPAPDQFLDAARELGATADQCIVIEDSRAGTEAGRAAGMAVIGVGPALARRPDLRGWFATLEGIRYAELARLLQAPCSTGEPANSIARSQGEWTFPLST